MILCLSFYQLLPSRNTYRRTLVLWMQTCLDVVEQTYVAHLSCEWLGHQHSSKCIKPNDRLNNAHAILLHLPCHARICSHTNCPSAPCDALCWQTYKSIFTSTI